MGGTGPLSGSVAAAMAPADMARRERHSLRFGVHSLEWRSRTRWQHVPDGGGESLANEIGKPEESQRELGSMIIARLLRNASIAAGAIVAVMSFGSGSASAQLFWDWGGGGMIGGSGREFVRFSPQFKKGEIVVSFGDRRLYFVTAPGQALSYPIAIPREESR